MGIFQANFFFLNKETDVWTWGVHLSEVHNTLKNTFASGIRAVKKKIMLHSIIRDLDFWDLF